MRSLIVAAFLTMVTLPQLGCDSSKQSGPAELTEEQKKKSEEEMKRVQEQERQNR